MSLSSGTFRNPTAGRADLVPGAGVACYYLVPELRTELELIIADSIAG